MATQKGVSPQLYATVLTALWTKGYLQLTFQPKDLLGVLKSVIYSFNDTSYIASVSSLNIQDVNKTLSVIYVCANSTFSTNNTKEFWKCLTPASSTSPPDSTVNCLNLEHDLDAGVMAILFLISVIFIIVMSFIEKRKYRRKCCNGRPGAVVPLNMLDSYENRFGNALAFGATTIYCLNVLLGSTESVLGSKWGKIIASLPGFVGIFFKMAATVVIAMSSYPLFVCMRTPHKRAGSAFGIFYCILWLFMGVGKTVLFSHLCITSKDLGAASLSIRIVTVFGDLPQLLSLFLLLLKFLKVLVQAIRRRAEKPEGDAEDVYDNFKEGYMYTHVKSLLSQFKPEGVVEVQENFRARLKKKVYKWRPDFKYSTRVVCAFMVSSIVLYLLTLYFLYLCWYFLDYLLHGWAKTESFAKFIQEMFVNDKDIVEKVRVHLKMWIACFYVAIVLSTIKTVFVYLNMLAWYRGHIIRLRRGDRSWLPTSIRTLSASPASLLAASMKYAGFQVGYAAWGYLIFALLIWLVLSIAISFIFYPLFHGQGSFALNLLSTAWPGLLISLIVAFSQRLAAMFFFLQQRGKIISIDNRNAFHIASYFLFYFNIFLGLISCLLRIIKSIIVGVLFLERVQKSLLPRPFEKMDPGYYAYIGYILIEHSHANPVLCVFFYLLKQHIKVTHRNDLETAITIVESESDEVSLKKLRRANEEKKTSEKDRWRVIRNRWNVAYTLVNNPSLTKYRKHNLDAEENDPVSKETDVAVDDGCEGNVFDKDEKEEKNWVVLMNATPAVSV